MKETANILYLKQEDAIAAGVLDMKACLQDVEKCLTMMSDGLVTNPPKTSMKRFREDGSYHFKLNSMPVYIGGDMNRAGIKWAGESPLNAQTRKHPMGLDIMILSDPDTVLPEAIMDATLITAMRTAACTVTAIKYLKASNAKIVTVVGAGVIGRTMMMALRDSGLGFAEIRLADLHRERCEELATDFPELPIVVADSTEAACRGADIVVTATTTTQKIVDTAWLDSCTLRCQCGMNEFDSDVITTADPLVVDNWEQMSHFPGSNFLKLEEEGKIKREDAHELPDVVAGKASPRHSDNQKIMYMSRGLACLDLMVADRVYKTAVAKGIGQELMLWDTPHWI